MSKGSFAHQTSDTAEDDSSPYQKRRSARWLFSSWLYNLGLHRRNRDRARTMMRSVRTRKKMPQTIPSSLSVTQRIQNARLLLSQVVFRIIEILEIEKKATHRFPQTHPNALTQTPPTCGFPLLPRSTFIPIQLFKWQ